MSEQIVSTGNERDDDSSNDELRAAGFTLPSGGTLNEYEWDADTGRWVAAPDASTGRLAHRKRYDEHGFPLPQGPFMWEGYGL